jgi:hypothetical protein
MFSIYPRRTLLRLFLLLSTLILSLSNLASLASPTELTTYQKIMMAQTIGFCLYAEGIMSFNDSHEIVKTSLSREKVTENEVNSVILAKHFKEDLDAFIDLAGGCKRVVTVSGFKKHSNSVFWSMPLNA